MGTNSSRGLRCFLKLMEKLIKVLLQDIKVLLLKISRQINCNIVN